MTDETPDTPESPAVPVGTPPVVEAPVAEAPVATTGPATVPELTGAEAQVEPADKPGALPITEPDDTPDPPELADTPNPETPIQQTALAVESEATVARPKASPEAVAGGTVYRPRTDDDVLTNHFCNVISGPQAGRYGVYTNTASLGDDGYPDEVVVRTRDAVDENLIVKYSDIRPALAGGR